MNSVRRCFPAHTRTWAHSENTGGGIRLWESRVLKATHKHSMETITRKCFLAGWVDSSWSCPKHSSGEVFCMMVSGPTLPAITLCMISDILKEPWMEILGTQSYGIRSRWDFCVCICIKYNTDIPSPKLRNPKYSKTQHFLSTDMISQVDDTPWWHYQNTA